MILDAQNSSKCINLDTQIVIWDARDSSECINLDTQIWDAQKQSKGVQVDFENCFQNSTWTQILEGGVQNFWEEGSKRPWVLKSWSKHEASKMTSTFKESNVKSVCGKTFSNLDKLHVYIMVTNIFNLRLSSVDVSGTSISAISGISSGNRKINNAQLLYMARGL